MNDSTLITMRKDVFELILTLERAKYIQEKNIRSLQELVLEQKNKPVMSIYKRGRLIITKGGNS